MIRRFAAASAALVIASQLCACSHGSAVACEPTSRYAAAATAGPVRIPDDLNPPDETDSLRLPPDTGRAALSNKPCLETPPGFYADGAPSNPRGGTGQRRTGTSGAPTPAPRQAAPPPTAPAPATVAPAPESVPPIPEPTTGSAPAAESAPPVAAPAQPVTEPPPGGGDREITN